MSFSIVGRANRRLCGVFFFFFNDTATTEIYTLSLHDALPILLCAAVGDAVAQVTGARPKLSTGGGTSDGRFIAPLGAEVVELGVLNASIHKVNECVRVTDIEALHRMYVNVLRRLLG